MTRMTRKRFVRVDTTSARRRTAAPTAKSRGVAAKSRWVVTSVVASERPKRDDRPVTKRELKKYLCDKTRNGTPEEKELIATAAAKCLRPAAVTRLNASTKVEKGILPTDLERLHELAERQGQIGAMTLTAAERAELKKLVARIGESELDLPNSTVVAKSDAADRLAGEMARGLVGDGHSTFSVENADGTHRVVTVGGDVAPLGNGVKKSRRPPYADVVVDQANSGLDGLKH